MWVRWRGVTRSYESDYETAAGHAECLLTQPARRTATTSRCITHKTPSATTAPSPAWDGWLDGSSSYHSIQAFVQKGTTHGLMFQLAYTYAHALDNASSFENAGFGESDTWLQPVRLA